MQRCKTLLLLVPFVSASCLPFVLVCFSAQHLCLFLQPTLRKMVYLAIKEMATIADDVIIVTSSLTKDMTGKEDVYRASAIRALCAITDVCYFFSLSFASRSLVLVF